jgi:hypothetical protein
MPDKIIQSMLASSEPSVRYKVQTLVLGQEAGSDEVKHLQEEIRASARVSLLLSERQVNGQIPHHPYAKWPGAHWVLATLADLGYPPGDDSLIPLREQVLNWLLGPEHQKGIRTIAGRVRRCASQESNALYALLMLGMADERADELARRLVDWQWPDGGWNCDKRPEAVNSSFMESLIPLRALALYARLTGDQHAQEAAERAAQIFLKRELFKRQSDGSLMDQNFIQLHYPCYWHYDVLFGLKVMAEAGWIGDERCSDALDLLESKRLPDGGWPADAKYYHCTPRAKTGHSLVDWGGTSKIHLNEFVTLEALFVLKAAGRMQFSHGRAWLPVSAE